jgi:hypothetical protein
MILRVLIAMLAGWLQQPQQQVITYLQEENRVLKAQLGGAGCGSPTSNAAGLRRSPTRLGASACTKLRRWSRRTPYCGGTSA